jgi:hypothetical protein
MKRPESRWRCRGLLELRQGLRAATRTRPFNRSLPELDFEVGQERSTLTCASGKGSRTRLYYAVATGHSTTDVLGERAFQSGGSSWSGRSAGSEAAGFPAPLLAVAGAGGTGGA